MIRMSKQEQKLDVAWWALRIGFGAGPLLAGLDKFFNILANWEMYLSPALAQLLPVSGGAFMRAVGVVEIVAGILVLSRWTRTGAYVVAAWLVAIALNLIWTGGFYDVAVRDLEMAVGAFALARLTGFRQATYARQSEPVRELRSAA
jgi:uncharacterized membrane protein YphA (DoxX/SURF4 family)